MLSDWQNFKRLHLGWSAGCLGATVVFVLLYLVERGEATRWPGGGSPLGLVTGSLAALIMLFETALVVRKTSWFRRRRWLGSAQLWMKAHLWLGLLTVPLVLLHCGCHLGGGLTTSLVAIFAVVILSGLFGLFMQNLLPKLLLDEVPQETIASQETALLAQWLDDARRAIGRPKIDAATDQEPTNKPVTIGSSRRIGTQRPRDLHPARNQVIAERCEALCQAFDTELQLYLTTGRTPSDRLRTAARQRAYFDELRARAPAEARSAVDVLADLCERRKQWNLQKRLQFWLHSWLVLHLPWSIVLLVLLVAHVVFALRYA